MFFSNRQTLWLFWYLPTFTMLTAIYLITMYGKYLDCQNSDSDLVTSCFARILIGITSSSVEVSEYVLRLKYEFFSADHMKKCF